MNWRLIFIGCGVPVWLAGCAFVPTVDPSAETTDAAVIPDTVLEGIRDPLSIDTCRRTERDLTVGWQAKRYLCTHEARLEALQQVNDHEYVAYQYRIEPLAAQETDPQNPFILPAVAKLPTSAQTPVPHASLPVDKALPVQAPKPLETQIFRVWFPKDREVLGPKGMDKVLEMIPAVTDARQVSLRGVFEDTEILRTAASAQERERFSVGRALSVRNVWGREGVDLSKVKILHHQVARSGRYVEVTLND